MLEQIGRGRPEHRRQHRRQQRGDRQVGEQNAPATNSTCPPRKLITTGAAAAVGAMPAKNAASPTSCPPTSPPSPHAAKPIATLAASSTACRRRSVPRVNRVPRKVTKSIVATIHWIAPLSTYACGSSTPSRRASSSAMVRSKPACMAASETRRESRGNGGRRRKIVGGGVLTPLRKTSGVRTPRLQRIPRLATVGGATSTPPCGQLPTIKSCAAHPRFALLRPAAAPANFCRPPPLPVGAPRALTQFRSHETSCLAAHSPLGRLPAARFAGDCFATHRRARPPA